MAEFIANPRRAARAPARCHAAVISPQGHFEADTEDIGSMGCQVVSPKAVRRGDMLQLVVANEKLRERLKVTGRVAWVSAQAPWRVGIAFDAASLDEAARWFDVLLAAYPGLGGFRRVPDRIRTDQVVYLGPPPRFLVDFTREEAMLLRAIASGARVDELRAQLRDVWPEAQRALFSLIARQVVTFQRGQAVHPDTWTPILHDVEASIAVESMAASEIARAPAPPRTPPAPQRPAAPARRPAPEPRPIATPSAIRPAERGDEQGRSGPVEIDLDRAGRFSVRQDAAAFERPAWTSSDREGKRERGGAGGGWREPHRRSAEAQATYDHALAELEAANFNGAIALLRRALSLAPGDPEIAERLGKLAFRGTGRH